MGALTTIAMPVGTAPEDVSPGIQRRNHPAT